MTHSGADFLREFCHDRHVSGGRGVWKWDHYFEIYDRHFAKFQGRPCNLLEIGIYSGGSLDMWRGYLGPQVEIYGIDIQPECLAYEADGVHVFIGDQSSAAFWEEVKSQAPLFDIVIDDGSHKPRHQATTFSALLPHLAPGGVYLCEDIHGYPEQPFAARLHALAAELNDHRGFERHDDGNLSKQTTLLQAEIASIHFYPYVAVVEKRNEPLKEFCAPRQGNLWEPFKP